MMRGPRDRMHKPPDTRRPGGTGVCLDSRGRLSLGGPSGLRCPWVGIGGLLRERFQREPIGTDAFPFLNGEAVRLEEVANSGTLPADNFFQDRDQDGKGVTAQNAALGKLGDIFGFRGWAG